MKKGKGRPTKLTPEMLEKANSYLNEYQTLIPSAAGLAKHLGVSRSTLYHWAENIDEQFSDILEKINITQELKLMDGGLSGDMNATIVKLALGKHGYSDKQETNHGLSDPMQELIKKVSGNTIGPA